MGHTVRGVLAAWLGLVVLETVVKQGGSGRVAGLVDTINSLVQRAFDPNVPAIPDHSKAAAGSTLPGTVGAGLTTSVIEGGRSVTTGSPYSPDSRPTGPR